jgi:hypothetical protein
MRALKRRLPRRPSHRFSLIRKVETLNAMLVLEADTFIFVERASQCIRRFCDFDAAYLEFQHWAHCEMSVLPMTKLQTADVCSFSMACRSNGEEEGSFESLASSIYSRFREVCRNLAIIMAMKMCHEWHAEPCACCQRCLNACLKLLHKTLYLKDRHLDGCIQFLNVRLQEDDVSRSQCMYVFLNTHI